VSCEWQVSGVRFRALALIGRVNATSLLDKNRFAYDPHNQFLNISMDNDPLFGAFVGFFTYAVLLGIPIMKKR
jgi:hypothetical protein